MRDRPLCGVCLILSALICLSVCLGGERLIRELRPSPAEIRLTEGNEIRLSGRVYQREEKDKYQLIYLKNVSVSYQQHSLKEFKAIVYDEKKKKIKIGDEILADGELHLFQSARNPGNFDQRLYYRRQKTHVGVWAESVRILKGSSPDLMEKLRERLCRFRADWQKKLCAAMGKKDGGTLCAMLLGEKSQMDTEVKELYQANGIGHILAISGLHLSLLGVGAYLMIRRICGSYIVGGIAGMAFLGLYILMIGPTVSAQRALIMFLFRVGADMTGRSYDSVTALSFAAAVVLIRSPLCVYDGGFWMSFGAIIAITLILPAFRDLPLQGFWASVSINLVLLPVIARSFYEFPTYSVILNLFVIPLMSVLLCSGLAGSLLCALCPPAGVPALRIAGGILRIYEKTCEWFLDLPGARIVIGKPALWQVFAYYVLLVAAAVCWRKRSGRGRERKKSGGKKESRRRKSGGGRKRKAERKNGSRDKRRILSVLFIVVGMSVLCIRFPDIGHMSVTMIDVGQGDSFFIRGPKGGTYLVDGGSSDVSDVGKYRIEPFLKSRGVKELDYVFVSHGDEDHMNGIEELMERSRIGVRIRTLVLPVRDVWDEKLEELADMALSQGIRVVTIRPGEGITEGRKIKLRLSCLAPGEDFPGEVGNEASMALALSYGEFDMLFTGDTEGKGEEELTEEIKKREEKADVSWEVLKAAHHGSKNSTEEEFLETARPEITLISAGQENRYGHPHRETVERLRKAGSRIYCTKETGAVTVIVDSRKYTVRKFVDA